MIMAADVLYGLIMSLVVTGGLAGKYFLYGFEYGGHRQSLWVLTLCTYHEFAGNSGSLWVLTL